MEMGYIELILLVGIALLVFGGPLWAFLKKHLKD